MLNSGSANGDATVNVLAQPFDMSLQAISRHLKVLEGAGLISRGRLAQFRPCRFEATPLDAAVAWIEENCTTRNERFEQLEQDQRDIRQAQRRPSP